MQRVRVGMTGLASVLIIIGLASVIFNSANRGAPVDAVGAAKPDTVANMTDGMSGNAAAAKNGNDPLAELGVAPSTDATEPAAPVTSAARPPAGGATRR